MLKLLTLPLRVLIKGCFFGALGCVVTVLAVIAVLAVIVFLVFFNGG